MKYLLTILVFVLSGVAYGQQYHKCEIYQFMGGNTSKKELVCTKKFDKKGKVTNARYNNYMKNDIAWSYVECKDGRCEYLYEDTFLMCFTFKPVHDGYFDNKMYHSIDSEKTFYYYNNAHLVCKQVHQTYQHIDSTVLIMCNDCNPNKIIYRDTLDTVLIFYNAQNKKVKEQRTMEHSVEFYFYDHEGRLTQDSTVKNGSPFYTIVQYKYGRNGYEGFLRESSDKFGGFKTIYHVDRLGRTVEVDEYFHKDDVKSNRNDAFYLFCKDITEFDKQGRIRKTVRYFKHKLTTSHLFVYR